MALLSNADFIPNCLSSGFFSEPVYERFDVLIKRANVWLREHTNVRVNTVESIEIKHKSSGDIVINPDRSTYVSYGKHYTSYIRALRLWLVPHGPNDPPEPQQIGYYNVVPQPSGDGGFFGNPKYEPYSITIQKMNARLKNRPLPGKVLNLETQDMKYHTSLGGVDPDETHWREGKQGVYYVNILRVFFEVGPPRHEEIGFADFKPGYLGSSAFEPFGKVVSRTSQWIAQHPNLSIVSIQSCNYKVKSLDNIDTHRAAYYEQGASYTYYLRIIRVGYVVSPEPPDYAQATSAPVSLTYKTFKPCCLSTSIFSNSYEGIDNTVKRATHWLHHAGVKILSVETVVVRLDGGHQHGNPEVTYTRLHGNDPTAHWLYVVRCYFSNRYIEPNPRALPPVPTQDQADDDCCIIL